MQLRGWGADASGAGAEAGKPRRCPEELESCRQGPKGGTPGLDCAQRQREEATDLCRTGCPRRGGRGGVTSRLGSALGLKEQSARSIAVRSRRPPSS